MSVQVLNPGVKPGYFQIGQQAPEWDWVWDNSKTCVFPLGLQGNSTHALGAVPIIGTLTNGAASQIGRYGAQVAFDGNDQHIELGTIPLGHPLQMIGGGTIVALIRPIQGDVFSRVCDKSSSGSGTGGYTIDVHTDGDVFTEIDGATGLNPTSPLTFGEWVLLTVTTGAATADVTCYFDDVLQALDTQTAKVPVDTAVGMRIGDWNTTTERSFNGDMSYLMFLPGYIINQAQVSQISNDWFGFMRTDFRTVVVKAPVVGGTTPKGPFGHPFYGPFAGPVTA